MKDSEYTPPESLHNVLRKYQRDGYRWLRTLDGYGMGGILADDMGLGKTVQVLSYLLAMKESGQRLPSLIVCPASLVLNWQEECQKFTPQLSCVAVDGDAAHRAELAKQWAEADLVVTSYDLMRRDEELYSGQQFYACILDEAQAIKNHTTQKYKAVCGVNSKVRFALTGTPVENRLGELWSIFSFLMPGYLPPYKTFCARFEKPIVQEDDKDALRRLNQLTGPFILRRMKSEVLKELPPRPRISTASSWTSSNASSTLPLWWTRGKSCALQSRRIKWRCSQCSCACGRSAATRALWQTTGTAAVPSWTPAWSW
ncbi:MAG: SNF2-related protein [Faecalibacterium sp.]